MLRRPILPGASLAPEAQCFGESGLTCIAVDARLAIIPLIWSKRDTCDWKHFCAWRRREGLTPLPPDPQIVGLYVTAQASGAATATCKAHGVRGDLSEGERAEKLPGRSLRAERDVQKQLGHASTEMTRRDQSAHRTPFSRRSLMPAG